MNYSVNLCNDFCKLTFHRQSLRGTIRDYIITFNDKETDLEIVITKTADVFKQLIETVQDFNIKARIIAEVEFSTLNDNEVVTYHFASYQTELVIDPDEFYTRHFSKIISRLDQFNNRGSNLLLNKIKHIHLALSLYR